MQVTAHPCYPSCTGRCRVGMDQMDFPHHSPDQSLFGLRQGIWEECHPGHPLIQCFFRFVNGCQCSNNKGIGLLNMEFKKFIFTSRTNYSPDNGLKLSIPFKRLFYAWIGNYLCHPQTNLCKCHGLPEPGCNRSLLGCYGKNDLNVIKKKTWEMSYCQF